MPVTLTQLPAISSTTNALRVPDTLCLTCSIDRCNVGFSGRDCSLSNEEATARSRVQDMVLDHLTTVLANGVSRSSYFDCSRRRVVLPSPSFLPRSSSVVHALLVNHSTFTQCPVACCATVVSLALTCPWPLSVLHHLACASVCVCGSQWPALLYNRLLGGWSPQSPPGPWKPPPLSFSCRRTRCLPARCSPCDPSLTTCDLRVWAWLRWVAVCSPSPHECSAPLRSKQLRLAGSRSTGDGWWTWTQTSG